MNTLCATRSLDQFGGTIETAFETSGLVCKLSVALAEGTPSTYAASLRNTNSVKNACFDRRQKILCSTQFSGECLGCGDHLRVRLRMPLRFCLAWFPGEGSRVADAKSSATPATLFSFTPWPRTYSMPKLPIANASPCSDALRYHSLAFTKSILVPRPFSRRLSPPSFVSVA